MEFSNCYEFLKHLQPSIRHQVFIRVLCVSKWITERSEINNKIPCNLLAISVRISRKKPTKLEKYFDILRLFFDVMFLSYITFRLIRGTILEGYLIITNYLPDFHMHLCVKVSVAMRPQWSAQACKKGNWRGFYYHRHLLSQLDISLCSHFK